MKNKKGIQLGQAFGAVLMLILVAILVIISIYLFVALNGSLPYNTGSVVNETGGFLNGTTYTLKAYQNGTAAQGTNCVISQAINNTDGVIIVPANYSVTNCVVKNLTSYTSPNVNYTYTYSYYSSAQNSGVLMITAFAGYPALVGLLGTIIFLGLVIGVLVASFAFGGKKGV